MTRGLILHNPAFIQRGIQDRHDDGPYRIPFRTGPIVAILPLVRESFEGILGR